ncbi:hypothetical protein C1645_876058 [Glomus cerebriforme]|uniref:F-box domain-containing protein n=1 Tax=Glomus cerebriforme TaxID=658196 RepID=A0A397T2Y8_9GLOM|nr:hypothetical protein C1645_876058 [Glomus cerebriforme]
MSFQHPSDCLNEIFEYLEEDIFTLHSCLLVNRFWCEVSVSILWKNVWNVVSTTPYQNYIMGISDKATLLHTLTSCLPKESKDLLYDEKIISTPILKPPLFNYVSFCKVLSIDEIHHMSNKFFCNRRLISANNSDNLNLLLQEILKMFMSQTSLKELSLTYKYESSFSDKLLKNPNNITLAQFPGARNCLTNLSELTCSSNVDSEFFHQLSQICHNIQSLNIRFKYSFSSGINVLISSLNNLKYFSLTQIYNYMFSKLNVKEIESSLTKHSNTIIRLHLRDASPLLFITHFKNLQELVISFEYDTSCEDFKQIQFITFPHLKILKFVLRCPKVEIIIKFLKNNGQNLEEFYVYKCNNRLNYSIAEYCPNLKIYYAQFMENTLETLKLIFVSCQQLESIKIWTNDVLYGEGKEMLNIVANYSPKTFHELRLYESTISNLDFEDLESFFIKWKNRIPQKSLSFIIHDVNDNNLEVNDEFNRIIKRYKNLGVIKKFEIIPYQSDTFLHVPTSFTKSL